MAVGIKRECWTLFAIHDVIFSVSITSQRYTAKKKKKEKKGDKGNLHDDCPYKTSIIFSVRHVPGALFGILGEFAIRKINLTKIESRPTKETPWEYNFYVDFEGHLQNKAVHDALMSIKPKISYMKILGSYKKAEFH